MVAPSSTTARVLTLHHQLEGGPVPDDTEHRAGLRFPKPKPARPPRGPHVNEIITYRCSECSVLAPRRETIVDHIQRIHPAE